VPGSPPPLRFEGRVDPGPMGHSALVTSSTFGETRRGSSDQSGFLLLAAPAWHLATLAIDVADDPSRARFEDSRGDAVTPTDHLDVDDAMQEVFQATKLDLVSRILTVLELRSEGLPHVHRATLAPSSSGQGVLIGSEGRDPHPHIQARAGGPHERASHWRH
jgi:hypothetical protein